MSSETHIWGGPKKKDYLLCLEFCPVVNLNLCSQTFTTNAEKATKDKLR